MYKMELLILTSHTTYAMHGGSFLWFVASATHRGVAPLPQVYYPRKKI